MPTGAKVSTTAQSVTLWRHRNDVAAIRRMLERQNRNFEHCWQLTVNEMDEVLKTGQEAKIE